MFILKATIFKFYQLKIEYYLFRVCFTETVLSVSMSRIYTQLNLTALNMFNDRTARQQNLKMKISHELYGLVVSGGESRRMGVDKSSLIYFEKQQRYHVHDMLYSDQNSMCSKAFISCNRVQAGTILKEYNVLLDLPKFENTGPIAGLLTAFTTYPDNNFLVIGCDYPFINNQVLKNFLEQIKGNTIAAAFYNKHEKYEPLLAWYSKKAGPVLKKHFDNQEYSLQHFLVNVKAGKYIPADEIVMKSVDTQEEFIAAKTLLST